MPRRYNLSNYTLVLCAAILVMIVWLSDRKIAIDGDGKDYYSYLNAVFITKNFTHQSGNDWFLIETPTGTINVHTMGVSLMMLPFFLIAYGVSAISGFPLDGVSLPFQLSAFAAGIFYCLLGLRFLQRLLLELGFSDRLTALVLLLCCFGTHLLRFTVAEPAMSHVYSFALVSMLLFYGARLERSGAPRYFYYLGLILGMIVLVRPVNVLCLLFLPFFAKDVTSLLQQIKQYFRSWHLYGGLMVFLLVCSFQSIAWVLQNGKWLQDSYQGNGFYFLRPQPLKMLFGFNNGLFVYVPLCLIFLSGLLVVWKENRYKALVLGLALLVLVYVFSAYWAYNYFDGLGIRSFVELIPVLAILGAFLLRAFATRTWKKIALTVLVLTAFSLNVLYHYQYQQGIIQGNGMNFNKYRYTFLKTDRAYADSLGGCWDLKPYVASKPKLIYEGQLGTYDYRDKEFGVSFEPELQEKASTLYAEIEFDRKEELKNASYDALITMDVSTIDHQNKAYQSFRLNETPASSCCEWKHYSYAVRTNGKFEKGDKVTVYVWNTRKADFTLRNFKVRIIDYSYKL